MSSAYREVLKDEWIESLAQLEVLLERVTWRPDTKIRLHPDGGGLRIKMRVQDTYNPERTTIVTHMRSLPELGRLGLPFHQASVDWWCRRILSELDRVDHHETREWFKIDGVMIYDPHEIR